MYHAGELFFTCIVCFLCLLCWQCDGVRTELRELQNLFETSQKERAELELELLSCREELEKLTEERQV